MLKTRVGLARVGGGGRAPPRPARSRRSRRSRRASPPSRAPSRRRAACAARQQRHRLRRRRRVVAPLASAVASACSVSSQDASPPLATWVRQKSAAELVCRLSAGAAVACLRNLARSSAIATSLASSLSTKPASGAGATVAAASPPPHIPPPPPPWRLGGLGGGGGALVDELVRRLRRGAQLARQVGAEVGGRRQHVELVGDVAALPLQLAALVRQLGDLGDARGERAPRRGDRLDDRDLPPAPPPRLASAAADGVRRPPPPRRRPRRSRARRASPSRCGGTRGGTRRRACGRTAGTWTPSGSGRPTGTGRRRRTARSGCPPPSAHSCSLRTHSLWKVDGSSTVAMHRAREHVLLQLLHRDLVEVVAVEEDVEAALLERVDHPQRAVFGSRDALAVRDEGVARADRARLAT